MASTPDGPPAPRRTRSFSRNSDDDASPNHAPELNESNNDRVCRICYGGEADEPECGPLFRPCSCRGSMAWVHMNCLDTWRNNSANPRSFYRCEQCHFEYKFGRVFAAYDRFTLVRFLQTKVAVHLLSLLALCMLVFSAGFVAKTFDSSLTWWDVIHCLNVQHIVYGSMATGLGSLFGWAISIFGGLGPRIYFESIGMPRIDANDKAGKIILGVFVVVGLVLALVWIFGKVNKWADRAARQAQYVVLDAHLGRVPGAATPRRDGVEVD